MSRSSWEKPLLRARIRLLWGTGLTVTEIAAETGYCEVQVRRIAQAAGLAPRLRSPSDEQIVELGRKGRPLRSISLSVGGSEQRIRAVLLQHGIPFRRPGRPLPNWRPV